LASEEPNEPNPNRIVKNYSRLQEPDIQAAYQAALQCELQKWSLSLAPFTALCNDANAHEDLICKGLDSSYDSLIKHIGIAEAASIPTKCVNPNARSWWDEELQELIELRSQAHEDWKRHSKSHCFDGQVPDATYKLLWNKYVQLRRRSHTLASSKRNQQYQDMLSNLETDYISDRQHFFKEILKIRRKKMPNHQITALHDPHSRQATSQPDEVKQILFELHSSLGKEDPNTDKFDQPHYHTITSIIAAISPKEVGPNFCEEDISFGEIEDAISKAENHKACGMDQIHNEALKHGGDAIISALQALFNLMLRTSSSPSLWAKALVHLIFKGRGADSLDPRAYRPISLTSCISKVFERVILNRLVANSEKEGLLEEEQAGFRTGRSTRDQTFILRELLDKRKAEGQTTFLCFIDLTNAFSSSWQDGMWFRLRESGVAGRLYRSIKDMYRSCSSAIQTPFGLTDWFTSDLGTRQGAVLSPYLFSLLISPLACVLRNAGLGVSLGLDSQIACLLYADDLVLIADSEEALQKMMLETTKFLKKWRFSVSAKKTQVVACGKGETRKLKDRTWEIGGKTIRDARSYKYLGLHFEKTGLWSQMRDANIENSHNAFPRSIKSDLRKQACK
jgi:hypothetical protein